MRSKLLKINRKKNVANLTDDVKKKKLSYIDKLFIRIFLSSLVVLILISLDYLKINITSLYKDNLNFLKLANVFNGNFGNFISSDIDKNVYSINTYDEVLYDKENNVNIVYNYGFDGIYNLENGIVTKIIRNNKGLYEVTIKGYDGYNYTYIDIENIDYHIYSYIGSNDIIGLSKYDSNLNYFTFKLKIEKGGVYYDYYANAQD